MTTSKEGSGKDLSLIDQEMEQAVANLKGAIAAPAGNKLTINDAGEFVGVDGMVLGNKIEVVIIDFITAHRYYPFAYNEKNPTPPVCFAFGRQIDEMVPYDESPEMQNVDPATGRPLGCATCWANQFKSAPNGGNGKACQNKREIALITADQFEEENPVILTYGVAPTSIQNFDGFVAFCKNVHEALPIKLICEMSTEKKPRWWGVRFQPVDTNPLYREHWRLRGPQIEDMLARLPDLSKYVPSQQAPRPGPPAPRR